MVTDTRTPVAGVTKSQHLKKRRRRAADADGGFDGVGIDRERRPGARRSRVRSAWKTHRDCERSRQR